MFQIHSFCITIDTSISQFLHVNSSYLIDAKFTVSHIIFNACKFCFPNIRHLNVNFLRYILILGILSTL